MSTKVQLKKEIWNWAIKESQKDKEAILNKFPNINQWIGGEENPTFKQLENFANYLKIPFGYLFLEVPPQDHVLEVEFRSIKNKLPKMSKNLKDTIMEMDIKRNWMNDYRKSLGWGKLDVIVEFNKLRHEGISVSAALAKKLLQLDDNWYESVKDVREAYNFLRNKIENVGVLVMQNGVVGSNNHRKLNIHEFRAFMLFDEIAPLIFINNTDSQGGKIFSLIHEFIHVLLERENLFLGEDIYKAKENERNINKLVAEFLMPEKHILYFWNKDKEPLEQISKLSSIFKVSETALVIKLRDMSLISDKVVAVIISESNKNFKSKQSGGDFYNTFSTKISPTFTEAVIRSAETGEISYTYAFRLLGGIKGKTYDEIKERFMYHG